MPNPPRTPAECFSTIILWLSLAVDGHSTWGRLPRPFGLLILDRIRSINARFARIAARITAGTFLPRRSPAPHPRENRGPRGPNKLPRSVAWLIKLLPEVAVYGSQLQFLFADPEMAALLEAAPASLRRPLRSLCRMLGVTPPPILALPARPRPPSDPQPEPPPSAPATGRRAPSRSWSPRSGTAPPSPLPLPA